MAYKYVFYMVICIDSKFVEGLACWCPVAAIVQSDISATLGVVWDIYTYVK